MFRPLFHSLLLVGCAALVCAQVQTHNDLQSLAAGLQVGWNIVTNTKENKRYQAEITLRHTAANQNLTLGDWQIHFSCGFRIESQLLGFPGNKEAELQGQGFNLTHVQGDHYYLRPTEGFIPLAPGASRKIKFKIDGFSVARTDSMPNWYITYPKLSPVVIASTQGEDLAFVAPRTQVQQWKRFSNDDYNSFSPQERYQRNFITDSSYSSETRVLPKPASMVMASKAITVSITKSWNVTYGSQLAKEAGYLAGALGLEIGSDSRPGPRVIHLQLGDVSPAEGQVLNSSDSYRLTINATAQRIDVVGQGVSGVFYGVVTLLSLMNNENEALECVVTDGPRFEYRGLMLDLVRSFHPKEEILNLIEVMSSYKLNKLHLLLSGDEGWRIEVPALPELTELGSKRCHDPSETQCLLPQLGSGPDNTTMFGSGFLTTSDYTEILQRANDRHVTVIPEIDMPGHGRAAILSMKLRNSTQAVGRPENSTTLTEPSDPSEYSSSEMFSDNAINPCLNSTYNFIGIIMDELINLHSKGQQPLKTFHFGGGKVVTGAWQNSTACKNLIASGNAHQVYFFQKLTSMAAERNLSLGVKEDGVLDANNNPLNLQSAINSTLVYSWNSFWKSGTLATTYKLANQGFQVILTHASHLYLDHANEPDPEERGTYWAARFTDTKKLFSYNAASYYDNSLTGLTGAALNICSQATDQCPPLLKQQNIVGLEGSLLTGTTRTRDQLYESLFPRLLALAERSWHQAPWESLSPGEEQDKQFSKDWASFARTVGYRELPRLEQRNVTFRIPPPGAVVSFGRLLTTPLYPGLVVQYLTEPGLEWQDAPAAVPVAELKDRVWLRTRTADSLRFSRTVAFDQGPEVTVTNQPVIDYIGQNLGINYTVVDNFKKYGDTLYEASIKFSNLGEETIPGGNWRIYFVSVYVVEPSFILGGHEYIDLATKLTISHTVGSLYSLGPAADFPGLAAGAELEFNFRVSDWSVSRYEQMPRWYVSSPGMNARDLIHTIGDDLSFVSPFLKPEQWKRTEDDRFVPFTPEIRYKRNLDREAAVVPGLTLVPTPSAYRNTSQQTVSLLDGSWTLVFANESLRSACQQLKDLMTLLLPAVKLDQSQTAPAQRFVLFQLGSINSSSAEAYRVRVLAQSQSIEVMAAHPKGVFYGAMTLIQLAVKSSPAGSIRECQVEDSPRLPYRGMHVDTARHFIPKETILKLLKAMALYKLNKLHFHLADDEGWRLEIPGLEELTEIGGHRCHDLQETECIMSTYGSGADDSRSGGGFYTVNDYKEILQLAQNLQIQVIPMFDTPGHAHAAIAAMKARQARLKDIGDHDGADEFVMADANDTSYYFSVQYYTDNAVNPCLNSSYRFIEEVYKQVTELHKDIQPLEVFHFGGDEVARGAWVNSSACTDLRMAGVNLKSLFTQRVSQITKDVALEAWEDGLMDHDSTPWDRSLLDNKDVIVNAWQNVWEWGFAARAYNLANNGYKVVFSPVTHMYFDHPQEPSPEERGLYWGTRYTDAFKTFSFMPDNYYQNADIRRSGVPITLAEICGTDNTGCPPLTKPENIFGLQGQLFAETVHAPEDFEYMVFPRLLSLAERAWHKGPWETEPDVATRNPKLYADWSRFAQSLGSNDLAILDRLGVAYRVPPPGASQQQYSISTKVEFPGLQVQSRTAGAGWKLHDEAGTFSVGQVVSLRTVSADGKRFSQEIQVVIAQVPRNGAVRVSGLSVLLVGVAAFLSQLV